MSTSYDTDRRRLDSRAPAIRPRALWYFTAPVLLAAVVGLAAGVDVQLTVAFALAVLVGGALLLRLELSAMAVVAAAVFEDYLALVSPYATKGLAVVLVAAWLIRVCWRPPERKSLSPVVITAMVFTIVLLVATVVHSNGPTGTDVVLRYVGFLAVLAVLVDTMRSGLAPARVARAYVGACAVAAVCGLLTFAVGADRRVGGPVADPNDFGFFLVAAVPLALALRANARRPWVYDVGVGLMVVATFGTLSRGALIGLVVMLGFALVSRMMSLRAAIAVVGAGLALTAILVGTMAEEVGISLTQKDAVADQNISERLDLWRAASDMTVENPVLGLGPGAFSLYHNDYRDRLPDDVTHKLDVAHNTYLEISAELGILGLLAFLALLVTAVLSAWSRWSRDRDRLAAAVCVSLVGTSVAALFVTEQYFLPLWLLAALAAAMLHPPDSTDTLMRPRGG